MSLICRVVMGYFDAHVACAQRSITPTRPVDEEEVDCLQAACGEAFGLEVGLSRHLTREGVLRIEDVRVRRDTYKAAAVAHSLFGMSVVDHAHRDIIFPSESGVQEWVRRFTAAWRSRVQRSWLTSNVLALAHLVKDDRQFDVLPILADALEEAGCTDLVILDHLRRPGIHARACWAVDLVLAQEEHQRTSCPSRRGRHCCRA
jgi:hypothetical protein